MTLAGAGLTREPKGRSTREEPTSSGQEGTSREFSLVRLYGVAHCASPMLFRGPCGRTAGLRQPGRTDPPTPGAEGARDCRLIALQVHGTGLQGRKVMDVEDGEFLIHDTVDRRIQLEPFLLLGSAPCFCNKYIGFFVFK